MDLPTDITIQCMDDTDVPVSLKSPVATSRALDQWQSRLVHFARYHIMTLTESSHQRSTR